MIKKFVFCLVKIFTKDLNLDNKQEDKITFTLEVIITDISKILIIFLVSSIANLSLDFIIILLFSIPLRINIGGFHMKKYINCLIFSLLYIISIFILNNYLNIHKLSLLILSIISTILIFILSPVIPKERLTITYMDIYKFRNRATILSILYILLYIVKYNPYTSYGVWVILTQTFLILIAKGVKINEKRII